jgi:hypothetical protein
MGTVNCTTTAFDAAFVTQMVINASMNNVENSQTQTVEVYEFHIEANVGKSGMAGVTSVVHLVETPIIGVSHM